MARRPGVTHQLVMLHWMPVEMYPPAINIARHFAGRGWDVTIHTTENRHGLADFAHPGVTVHRSANPSEGSLPSRVKAYASFHVGTTRRLVAAKPDAMLYFEPQSSLPAALAGLLREVPLFIHHHEYHEPGEFAQPGMRFARVLHRLEQSRLFGRARWISHTNGDRLEMFLRDNPRVKREIARVLPNLPPASWAAVTNRAWAAAPPPPLRMAYVGSVSLADTYMAEVVRWVLEQRAGLVSLDVFAYNYDDETRDFLSSAGDRVRFHSRGVPYDDLPRVLSEFHTGLILYKGNTVNYRHNATNKLFEYAACGLDVVFPHDMPGVLPYARADSAPRILPADFTGSDSLDLAVLSHRVAISTSPLGLSAESAIGELESVVATSVAESARERTDR